MYRLLLVGCLNDYVCIILVPVVGRAGGLAGTNLLYKNVDIITNDAPTRNSKEIENWNINTDPTHEMMIAEDVAKPFNILSAYFTTTATMRPPHD